MKERVEMELYNCDEWNMKGIESGCSELRMESESRYKEGGRDRSV